MIKFGSEAHFLNFSAEWLNTSVLQLIVEKGKQYSDGGQALDNINSGAENSGLAPAHFLMVLAAKHWNSLMEWSAGKRPELTYADIASRTADIIVYMLLLTFMETIKIAGSDDGVQLVGPDEDVQ
jgi:hypothetical protein